jgi:hypothetical protein
MNLTTIQQEIEEAIPKLLGMARELAWNKISDNCKFILTEIKDSSNNFHTMRSLIKNENDRKYPAKLQELIPALQQLYSNIHDINLYIYKTKRTLTTIDIRYYLKSSLDDEYRQKVFKDPPMLHLKVAIPPWVAGKKEKFNINWEHHPWMTKWRLFLLKRKHGRS